MRIWTNSSAGRRAGLIGLAAIVLLVPAAASAQFAPPQDNRRTHVLGEQYHVEVSGNFWNPALFGVISSEQFGQPGSDIDFDTDFGFERTRFKDVRSWKVWRFGYEYDFIYQPWGFVGVLLETRITEFDARLQSAIASEFTTAKGPLPAVGVVARGYVHPTVALNFEFSGMRLPDIDPNYEADYWDWDLYGTVNFSQYVGFQMGYRKQSTYLAIEKDSGDLSFKGIWFGAALRF
jgi:hypothetical protein